ncbi:MAG: hypothetical protein RRY29_11405 [Desulfovibrionaceae bacterium]
MIAETLQQSVTRLRAMLARDNGDLAHGAPAVLDDLEADIERVRGLENTTVLLHSSPYYPLDKFQEPSHDRA